MIKKHKNALGTGLLASFLGIGILVTFGASYMYFAFGVFSFAWSLLWVLADMEDWLRIIAEKP